MFVPKLNAAGTAYIPYPWETAQETQIAIQRFTSGQVANAAATATIPAVAGQLAVITGFEVYAGGATAAALVNATLANVQAGAQLTYPVSAPAGAALAAPIVSINFDAPIQASAVNTAITVTLPALGAGNTAAMVIAKGYYTTNF